MSDIRSLEFYSEDELIGMVGSILAQPQELLTGLDHKCLEAINNEFLIRDARKKQEN